MFHFTYITASSDGYFYVGRHSTKNIDDKYQGSGKWVKLCKENNIELHTKILQFYSSFEELTLAEEQLIEKHINNFKNMNINNKSVGFAVGVLNPSNNKEVLKKRPQNNSGYISEYMKHNNPSTKDCVKKLRSEFMKDLWKDAEYKELHSGENHYMKQSHKRKQFSENNPMHRKEVVDKIKNRVMEAVKTGTHNSKILLECPHCNKSCSIPNAKRWHFNKCKMVKIK